MTIPEALYSLNLPELSEKSDLQLFSSKMFPFSYHITPAKRLRKSSARFRNWGIALNGWYITAQPSVCLSQDEGFILSDILMQNVPEKYFLSIAAQKKLQRNSLEECRGKESMT